MPRTNPAPAVTFDQMCCYEKIAIELRQKVGLGSLERLDPFVLAKQMGVMIDYSYSLTPKDWSGMSKPFPNGGLFVMLHRDQTPERKNVTLLEEIVHHFREHTPVVISGTGRSEYNEAEEQEAKFSAAAALLPMKVVAQAIWLKQDPVEVAGLYGASIELFEMRVKTLHLWNKFKRNIPLEVGV